MILRIKGVAGNEVKMLRQFCQVIVQRMCGLIVFIETSGHRFQPVLE